MYASEPLDMLPFPTDPLKKYGGYSGKRCSLFDSGYDPEQLWKLAPGACIYNQPHFGHVDPVYTAVWASCGVPTTFEDTSSQLKWEPNVAALWVALLGGPGFGCGFGNWLHRSRSLHENTSVVSQIILRAFPSTPVPVRNSLYRFTVSVENFVTWPKDTLSSVV